MASENAKAVARAIIKKVQKGVKVDLGDTIREVGCYKESIALHPQKVTKTKSYKEEMLPIVEQLEKERQRLIISMTEKDLSKVQYHHQSDVLDKLTKNIQLLGGGDTERSNLTIKWE